MLSPYIEKQGNLHVFYLFHCDSLYMFIVGAGATSCASEMTSSAIEDKEALFDRQASISDVSRPFLQAMAEGRYQDLAVKTFLGMAERYSKQHHISLPIDFPPEHPVEEVGRYVLPYVLS